MPATAAAIAATWAGVVPQQPPATLRSPCSAHSPHRRRHRLRRLVVAAELVREPRVRVGGDRPVGDPAKDVEVLAELGGAEGAVEPDEDRVGVADAVPERLDGLARERPPGRVDDRAGDDEREAHAELLLQAPDREDRGLGVEGVEDRLDEEDVGAALEQAGGRLAVGRLELLPRGVPRGRVVDVRRERGRPVGRPQRSGDVAGAGRVRPLRFVGRGAGEAGRRDVHLADDVVAQAVVGLGDAGRGERVGGDDVGPGGKVGRVRRLHGRRLRQAEEVVVAPHVTRVIGEARPAEVALAEAVALEHRPHRPVEDENPVREEPGEARQPGAARGGRSGRRDRRERRRGRILGGRRGHGPARAAHDRLPAACRSRIRRTRPAHCS